MTTLRYIGRRVLQTLIVLFFVSIFAFLLIRMASGSPARMMLPDDASEEQVAAMEEKLGLNKPLSSPNRLFKEAPIWRRLRLFGHKRRPCGGIFRSGRYLLCKKSCKKLPPHLQFHSACDMIPAINTESR